jgi:hypothetical protein
MKGRIRGAETGIFWMCAHIITRSKEGKLLDICIYTLGVWKGGGGEARGNEI